MERVAIGIVGLNFGRHVIHEIVDGTGCRFLRLVGVCSEDLVATREVALARGVMGYDNLDRMLADPAIEAVGLFTGPDGRGDLIRRIIRAGKHVLTTKPFECSADTASSVLSEAGRLGRVIHLNSPTPVAPPHLRQIRLWQDDLALGDPVACRADIWAAYQEEADGSWYDDDRRCPVAPIFRLGIYLINDLIYLLGKVSSVQVVQSRLMTGRPTADHAMMLMSFESGAIASVFASFCVNDGEPYKNALTVNFKNGTVYHNVGPGATHERSLLKVVANGHDGRREASAELESRIGDYDWLSFQRAVRGAALVDPVPHKNISHAIAVLEAMARAADSQVAELVEIASFATQTPEPMVL